MDIEFISTKIKWFQTVHDNMICSLTNWMTDRHTDKPNTVRPQLCTLHQTRRFVWKLSLSRSLYLFMVGCRRFKFWCLWTLFSLYIYMYFVIMISFHVLFIAFQSSSLDNLETWVRLPTVPEQLFMLRCFQFTLQMNKMSATLSSAYRHTT